MYTEDFEKLKKAINRKDNLEKLRIYGDILERLIEYIIVNKNNDSAFIEILIDRQKTLFSACEEAFDGLLKEESNVEGVERVEVLVKEYRECVDKHLK